MDNLVERALIQEGGAADSLASAMLDSIVGHSEPMKRVRQRLLNVALTDAPVLIYGETGTGKELVARALHELSIRSAKPFVAVNCGAYPNDLILNELFGHERGAYTGAVAKHAGLVSRAEGGVLFLDEVDSLSSAAQVVLLRFLQDRCYRPLGGCERRADVRIVSATHCDLQQKVDSGQFRSDLFFRLDVLRIMLPPLRERREDILTLFNYFARRLAKEHGLAVPPPAAALQKWLLNHSWPGNVRELESVALRWLLGESPVTEEAPAPCKELPALEELRVFAYGCAQRYPLTEAKAMLCREFERSYVRCLYERCKGNISQAAKLAGKERRAFGRLVKKYGLKS